MLLVQHPAGSQSFWPEAGPQLCRRGSQCPETDSGRRSQLLHTQLGQHKTLTHTHEWAQVYTRDFTWCMASKEFPTMNFPSTLSFQAHTFLNMTSPSGGEEWTFLFMTPPSEGDTVVSVRTLANLTKYGEEGGFYDITWQRHSDVIITDSILSDAHIFISFLSSLFLCI